MKNSHKTAISRKKPSVPMRWLEKVGYLYDDGSQSELMLDYGCGKGFDADYFGMAKYDPHFFPDVMALELGAYDIVTCNYVLNVVSYEEEHDLVFRVLSYLTDDGVAYFSVRRDIPRGAHTNKRGTYQRWVDLGQAGGWNGPELIRETSTYAIYKIKKEAYPFSR